MSTRRGDVPDNSHEAWLATLDPEVRLHAEAEIAFYNNEDLWEWETVEDDAWEPDPEGGMGLIVDFEAEEIQLLLEAFGRGTDFASLMKLMLLGRMQVGLHEVINPPLTTISAGASGLAER